ncbi:hypothetical protein C8R46DRAFT_1099323 [Mycena filopes]|nr:hypothetical protein C8R46DRAFT_1099323 [Mycena filopes]
MKFATGLLALCSAACAMSIPGTFPPANLNKTVDAHVYMGNATTITGISKRTLGTSYMCTAAFFSGYCVAITGETNGGCIDLAADLNNQISSFGPDVGQRCQLFNAHNCATSGEGTPAWSGFISSPGIQDFSVPWVDADGVQNAPFNDIISSYRCTFAKGAPS